ncbi:energy transducer TonB [Mucilaginibacter sp. X5P1]|uniref:energy transducer TonB n=1 Tax=Mucilaginibacter sp. X5P1 TaxID=2723088 RepID=UPI00161AD2CC|nr:energy transducer TonB [Mucilaginibacter sp. X5P1]MBB6138322.1 hypothetical protein [Mucilaginibacter sp. X5P1]
MKKLLLLQALLLFTIAVKAQDNKKLKSNSNDVIIDGPTEGGHVTNYSITKSNDTVYYGAEVEPSFPGGISQFYKYVCAHFDYNLLKQDSLSLSAKIFVTFLVKENGTLTNIKVLRGGTPIINSEIIKIVERSPKWNPGVQANKNVNVQYTVVIRLSSPNTNNQTAYQSKNDTLTSISKPVFRGGKEAYYKFLAENLRWPNTNSDIHGAIHLAFIVEEDGSLKRLHIVKGLNPELDAEALRVMKLSPPWTPAKVNHKPVRYYFRLHINYRMNDY